MKKKLKNVYKKFHSKASIFFDLLHFFWKQKLWWGIPLLVVLFLFMMILLVGSHTGITAIIYPLF